MSEKQTNKTKQKKISSLPQCPVITIQEREFGVDIFHLPTLPGKRDDFHLGHYEGLAVDTVIKIHTEQPPGDILLFLTGKALLCVCVRVCVCVCECESVEVALFFFLLFLMT